MKRTQRVWGMRRSEWQRSTGSLYGNDSPEEQSMLDEFEREGLPVRQGLERAPLQLSTDEVGWGEP